MLSSISSYPTPPDSMPPPGLNEAGLVLVYQATLARESWLAGALEGSGLEVAICRNLDELAEVTRDRHPDVLLLDWGLPDCDLLCQNLKLGSKRVMPIVVVDWRESTEDEAVRALTGGADEYFCEPARTLELRARIQTQLKNKRRLDTLTRIRAERDSLRFDARLDELTRVFNRRALGASLRELLREPGEFAVLFLDLDHFKRINDELGHWAGDRALADFAQNLKDLLRPGDVVGRYGGEEFVVLLRGANEDSALRVAERVRQKIETTPVQAVPWGLTVSTGVAVFDPFSGESAEDLVARADLALYRAKRSGRNCVVVAPSPREVTSPGIVGSQPWQFTAPGELTEAHL